MEEFHIIAVEKPVTKEKEDKARDVLTNIARIRAEYPDREFAISYNGELVDEKELLQQVKTKHPDFELPTVPIKPA